jgi:hypothetical protein
VVDVAVKDDLPVVDRLRSDRIGEERHPAPAGVRVQLIEGSRIDREAHLPGQTGMLVDNSDLNAPDRILGVVHNR